MTGVQRIECRLFLLLAALVVTAGCSDSAGTDRFEIETVQLSWSDGTVSTRLEQRLALSSQALEALERGVPLTLLVQMILRDTSTQTRIDESEFRYVIQFLPLSGRYQLSSDDGRETRSFPRLRHLLAEMGNLDFDLEVGVIPTGQYELMTRIRLDQRRLPLSMRLPIMFRPEWDHDSHWKSWPLELKTEIGP